jgi:hypothetical protein
MEAPYGESRHAAELDGVTQAWRPLKLDAINDLLWITNVYGNFAISGAPATFLEVKEIALVAHGERRNLFLGISILRSNESLPANAGCSGRRLVCRRFANKVGDRPSACTLTGPCENLE